MLIVCQIFYALEQRKRTFLERTEWKSIPWARTWIPKPDLQKLLDIAADIPGLLEDADSLDMQSSSNRSDLRHRILSSLDALCKWRIGWERLHPNSAFIVNAKAFHHRSLLQIETSALETSLQFYELHGLTRSLDI